MKFYGKRRNYRKKSAPKKKRTYKKRASVSTAVKQYVSRSIKVASENKVVNWQYNGELYNFNAASNAWYTMNFHTLSPNNTTLQITQGAAQGQRIGNRIKTVKGILKFVITPTPYSNPENFIPVPQMIRVVIFSSKPHPVGYPPFTNFQNNLFQFGNTSQGPINQILDQVADINKDMFNVYYDKMVKVGHAGINAGTAAGGTTASQYHANNDYKLNVIRKINITKYLPSQFLYSDSLTGPVAGKHLFVMFIQSNADGTDQRASQRSNKIYMSVDYTYEE